MASRGIPEVSKMSLREFPFDFIFLSEFGEVLDHRKTSQGNFHTICHLVEGEGGGGGGGGKVAGT